jgi:hypothetical protein
MNDEGLADVEAASPFRYPDFTQELICGTCGQTQTAPLTSVPPASRSGSSYWHLAAHSDGETRGLIGTNNHLFLGSAW